MVSATSVAELEKITGADRRRQNAGVRKQIEQFRRDACRGQWVAMGLAGAPRIGCYLQCYRHSRSGTVYSRSGCENTGFLGVPEEHET
jgi:hypothetical protein